MKATSTPRSRPETLPRACVLGRCALLSEAHMLALLTTLSSSAFLLQVPPQNYAGVAARTVEVRMRAPDEDFDTLFFKGGEAVTDGEMGKALGYFQRALAVDPTNVQTQAMVSKFESLGIKPVFEDEDGTIIDVPSSTDDKPARL